jgi:hypothetical protein
VNSPPRLCLSALVLFASSVAMCTAPPFSGAFGPPAVDRARSAATNVDGAKLKDHVAGIVAARAKEVPVTSTFSIMQPHVHLTSAEYMLDAFTAAGLKPTPERTLAEGMELTTVYADVSGERPDLVLVTGHHDAWFQSGADDNASALAVLVESARALKDTKPKRTIRFIAFDGEEEGLIGARRYLEHHADERIAVVINMDCVGYASHVKGSQDAPPGLSLRDTGDFLAVIANGPASQAAERFAGLAPLLARPADVLALLAPGSGRTPGTGAFLRSDHAPFWYQGTPALFLTDTANFRNHNYHTPDDTPEKLDYDFLARVGALTAAAAAAFAEED